MQSEDFQTEYSSDEKKRIISGELKQMPSDERNLLILYNRGLKYEEIAEILDMNPNSVGTTLARTIQKFRNTLKTKYHELFE
jgi:RNA polymerase sigma-70 factor (ECF subfamily)